MTRIRWRNAAIMAAFVVLIAVNVYFIAFHHSVKQVFFIHNNRQIDVFADRVHFTDGRVVIESRWERKVSPADTLWTPEEIPSMQQAPLKSGLLNGYVRYSASPVKIDRYQLSFPTADIKEMRIQKWQQASRSR